MGDIVRPLTVFAIPRAFERHIGIAQRNAIRSWLALSPRPRVILLGDDAGTAQVAREFGVEHIPEVECNDLGTPLLSSIFGLAHEHAGGGLMLFVNCDIILGAGLQSAIAAAPAEPFLLTGKRHHLIVREELDFSLDWEATLRSRVTRCGALGGANAMDYFLFTHGLFGKVPPFAIGRGWWDHWLAAEARRRGALLIDATPGVLAVHQDHNFLATEESIRNLALFGQSGDSVSLAIATHRWDGERLAPNVLSLRARLRGRAARALRTLARQVAGE